MYLFSFSFIFKMFNEEERENNEDKKTRMNMRIKNHNLFPKYERAPLTTNNLKFSSK